MWSRRNLPLYSIWIFVVVVFLAGILMGYWQALGTSLQICLGETILIGMVGHYATRRQAAGRRRVADAYFGLAVLILFTLQMIDLIFRLQPMLWSFGIRALIPDNAVILTFAALCGAAMLFTLFTKAPYPPE